MSVFLCRRKGHSDWSVHQGIARTYQDAAADYARSIIDADPAIARTFIDEDATIQIRRGRSQVVREFTFTLRLDPVFFMQSNEEYARVQTRAEQLERELSQYRLPPDALAISEGETDRGAAVRWHKRAQELESELRGLTEIERQQRERAIALELDLATEREQNAVAKGVIETVRAHCRNTGAMTLSHLQTLVPALTPTPRTEADANARGLQPSPSAPADNDPDPAERRCGCEQSEELKQLLRCARPLLLRIGTALTEQHQLIKSIDEALR